MADEEQILTNEIEMWSQKFEAYSLEKSNVNDIINNKKAPTAIGARSNSVGNRLYRNNKHSNTTSDPES